MKAKRELVAEFYMRRATRLTDGDVPTWTRTARDMVDAYFKALERDPEADFVLTLSKTERA